MTKKSEVEKEEFELVEESWKTSVKEFLGEIALNADGTITVPKNIADKILSL
jgi:hypothetical protein